MKKMLAILLLFAAHGLHAESFSYKTATGSSHGNWFQIRPGLVVTAWHNVKDVEPVIVNGSIAKKVAHDDDLDIALLEYDLPGPPLVVSKTDAKPGDNVVIKASFGSSSVVEERRGVVMEIYYRGWCDSRVRTDFGLGSSGAPVLNGNGEVIGMVKAAIPKSEGSKEPDLRYAIILPASAILDFLRRSGK
jgi:S1-C subfamily serine protease